MKEYAIGIGNGSTEKIKVRRMEDLPGGRQALKDQRRRELDFFNIDKMPGGYSPENMKILGERLRKLEAECSITGAIPGSDGPEFRG